VDRILVTGEGTAGMGDLVNRLVGMRGMTEEQVSALRYLVGVMRQVGEDPRYAEMAAEALRLVEEAFPAETVGADRQP
jgi:hypothetical protein